MSTQWENPLVPFVEQKLPRSIVTLIDLLISRGRRGWPMDMEERKWNAAYWLIEVLTCPRMA